MNIGGSMGRVLMQQTYHSPGTVGGILFYFYLFIYLFIFFFLLFWLLLLTGGVNITKVFSVPVPNKMVALSTGREVTNQVENNKGVSLFFFSFGGVGINAVP